MTAAERKARPVYSGVLRYFPKALLEIARVSAAGSQQHHPGEPLHWDRAKSTDDHDALVRHLLEAGTLDTDGLRHSAKVAWRALACLEKELEAAEAFHGPESGTKPSHDERYGLAQPCVNGCGVETYPGPACLGCQRSRRQDVQP